MPNPEGINQYTRGGSGDYHVVNERTRSVISRHETRKEAQDNAQKAANATKDTHAVGRAGTVYGTSDHVSTHEPRHSRHAESSLTPSDRALCTETMRALSNPEGINQYTSTARGATDKAERTGLAKDHEAAAVAHEAAKSAHERAGNKAFARAHGQKAAGHREQARTARFEGR